MNLPGSPAGPLGEPDRAFPLPGGDGLRLHRRAPLRRFPALDLQNDGLRAILDPDHLRHSRWAFRLCGQGRPQEPGSPFRRLRVRCLFLRGRWGELGSDRRRPPDGGRPRPHHSSQGRGPDRGHPRSECLDPGRHDRPAAAHGGGPGQSGLHLFEQKTATKWQGISRGATRGHKLFIGRNPLTINQQEPGNSPSELENSAAIHFWLASSRRGR